MVVCSACLHVCLRVSCLIDYIYSFLLLASPTTISAAEHDKIIHLDLRQSGNQIGPKWPMIIDCLCCQWVYSLLDPLPIR
jgi:hypothetical protein